MVRSQKKYLTYKEVARVLVHARLAHFNQYYKLPLRKVFIKNSRSRWGSCSTLGNLNFNYRIVFLPPLLQDYLVVHELCHLVHFNHGPEFWALVAEMCPTYKDCRRQVRSIQLV